MVVLCKKIMFLVFLLKKIPTHTLTHAHTQIIAFVSPPHAPASALSAPAAAGATAQRALPVVFVGDNYKPKPGFSMKKLYQRLARRATVIFCSEFRSSMLCCSCGGPVAHPKKMKGGDAKEDRGTSQCLNLDCALKGKFMNRDLAPTATIANLFLYSHVWGGERGCAFVCACDWTLTCTHCVLTGHFDETESCKGGNGKAASNRRLAFFSVFKRPTPAATQSTASSAEAPEGTTMTFTCVPKNAAGVNVASVGASAMADSAANAAGHTPATSPPVCLQCSVLVYTGFAVMTMHCFGRCTQHTYFVLG